MKYLRSIFFLSVSLLTIYVSGCSSIEKKMTDNEIFTQELNSVFKQQKSVRSERLLQSLREEYRKAATLSSISELELFLENYELSESEKNNALLNYFDNALLYMQIMILPQKRDDFLNSHIHRKIIYELSSIFLNITIADDFLARCPQENNALRNIWQENISDRRIEYDSLHINTVNAAQKMPMLRYPLCEKIPFESINDFRLFRSADCSVFDLARHIFDNLNSQYPENLSLILIKMLYKAPSIVNQLYYNDQDLKTDFVKLLTEIVKIRQDKQFLSNAETAFNLRSDLQKTMKNINSPSAEMLNAAAQSELAFQSACLKMLTALNLHPFSARPVTAAKYEQISEKRAKTLNFLFYNILKTIL